MIREATLDDMFDILSMSKRFMELGPDTFVFDRHLLEEFVTPLLDDPNSLVLVSDDKGVDGLIVGFCAKHPFCGYRLAQELIWWVNPEVRGGVKAIRLLQNFVNWSRTVEADFLSMGDVSAVGDLGKLYKRLGLEYAEGSYTMRIK